MRVASELLQSFSILCLAIGQVYIVRAIKHIR